MKRIRANWWFTLYAATAATAIFLAIITLDGFDVSVILYTFVGVPLISLIFALLLLVIALIRKRTPNQAYFLILPVFWAITVLLFINKGDVRLWSRWILHSHELKARLLASPMPSSGELRHIEWDGWGFAGLETVEYLVFDPTDSLARATESHSKGRFPGIPCEVPMVRRMERSWYVVMYYTDTEWSNCG